MATTATESLNKSDSPSKSETTTEDVKLYVNEQRFPQTWTFVRVLLFVVAFPLCFVLGIIRLFIGLQALVILCVMPKRLKLRRYFLRLVLMLIGVFVNIQKPPNQDSKPSVIVSNHVSVLDRLIIECSLVCSTLSVRDIPLLIRLVIGSLDLTPRHEAPPPTTVAKAHLETSDVPILTLPEQMMTNGQGILKFASWPFSISANVQVVCIDIQRLHVLTPHLTYLFSSPIADFFWTLFCPAHWANVRYLTVGDDWREKNPEQRALHAQNLISTELDIPALKLTCHDVNEYKKTIVKQRAKPVDIDSLVRQVIEVLPNIPESEIRADLMRTKDTTQTIYNLVRTAPKEIKKAPKTTPTKSSGQGSLFKDPVARSNMLELKKAELIADGRRRYIEKNGLDIEP
ncbi:lipid droplet-regulating VLDL assembly factor AUP1-like [Bolinopsis microptera]|uniref:lipid droplet-regulating VLDL assembly factor AUP1-like n=1 Tax=Bolinopsis microptera TaxID=2820187 RepID=UPI003078EA56